MTAAIVNLTGRQLRRALKETDLVYFPEEMETEEIDHEERMRMAMENIKFHKRKFWTRLGGSGLDGVKVFDEDDYDRLMKKLRRDN